MFAHLFDPANLPFAVALCLMFAIGLIEGLGTLLGMGLSGVVDQLVPDFDLDLDVDVDADVDLDVDADADIGGAHSAGAFVRLLGWLQVGRVPTLVLFVIYLMVFGLLGLTLQGVLEHTLGFMLPAWLAAVGVGIVALYPVRILGGILAHLIPKDETQALDSHSFVGLVAVVLQAPARIGKPAQAKLKDRFGQTHYVLVEPDSEGVELNPGEDVVLVKKAGATFHAIKNTNPALVEERFAG